jgi:DNA-binding GntR family transcriptional regulator
MARRRIASIGHLRGRIERRNVRDQLLHHLRAAIIQGRLRPGQSLTQLDLAGAYGVSRQPVRQAIEVLAAEGLLLKSAQGGVTVTPLEPGWARDLYEVRAKLEVLAVERAATRFTPLGLERLAAVVQEGQERLRRGDVSELIDSDQRFHHAIYRAAGNPVLLETLGRYWSQVARVMRAILLLPGYPADVWHQHADIAQALCARDAPQAAELMRRHILGSMELLLQHPALLTTAATEAPQRPPEARLCT